MSFMALTFLAAWAILLGLTLAAFRLSGQISRAEQEAEDACRLSFADETPPAVAPAWGAE
ncbi:hypothetical protein EBL89_03670 [Cereibacter sphaeroides]|uniref:hypothetical protein n=1 Tax=Cereibacter sphaeroides TaxID=1063 RepID=UPI000E5BF1E9|nr:hypothetical protein [Cereibacter sphaeroides]AZB54464.1 hypothetical protein EBL89_03670 [Cereibacter sphaeroides]AZB58738.1 hypothetical protein EBL88_03760 [Cereibacter sphaeroides]RIA01366.1 hypothetical protein D1122_01510 [Cereibacter sphaeroides]